MNSQSLSVLSTIPVAGNLVDIAVNGDILVGVTANSGYCIYSISNPESPVQLAEIASTSHELLSAFIDGAKLYIGFRNSGNGNYDIDVIDISNPTSPQSMGILNASPLTQPIASLHVVDRSLIAFAGSQGAVLINRDSGGVDSIDTLDFALAGKTVNNTVYVADSFGGLQIIRLDATAGNPQMRSIMTVSQQLNSMSTTRWLPLIRRPRIHPVLRFRLF